MNCDTKSELLLAHQKAADAYSKAVAMLAKGIGVVFSEYERLRILADRAFLKVGEARKDLESHVYEHCC